MAFSKYKGFHKQKLNSEFGMVVSSLRKENAYLKRSLAVLSNYHSEHIKLAEVNSVKLSCFSGFYLT